MNTRNSALSVMSLAVTLGLLAISGAASGGGLASAKVCQGCHGAGGVSAKEKIPTIAGISSFVHADYLYAFRDGARACGDPEFTEKCSLKNDLTDEQIEALAEYFAAMEFKPATQQFDADKAAAGAAIHAENCDKCHTDGGANPDDDSSILAGQWMAYMQQSLTHFASAERDQPTSMKRKMVGLSAADIEALAHYYASQQ